MLFHQSSGFDPISQCKISNIAFFVPSLAATNHRKLLEWTATLMVSYQHLEQRPTLYTKSWAATL